MIVMLLQRIEKLEALTKAMMRLREVRNFAKLERAKAVEEDKVLWDYLYHVTLDNLVLTERAIADLLPSGQYQYARDVPEP